MTELVCRSCSGTSVEVFLALGETPLANALLAAGADADAQPRYPLDVAFCADCTLVQLAELLPEDVLFDADYPYFSSYSADLLTHSRAHVDSLVAARSLTRDSLVVEVASNDGYLLRGFLDHGVPVLGVDPSPGPAAAAQEVGVETIVRFFGRDVAREVVAERGRADVVIANNVMAHVPDLDDFVGGLALLVADDGVVTVENPWVHELVSRRAFDTIYHEHLFYWSCTAVDRMVRRHGLQLLDVEHFPDLHAGTLRWTLGRQGTPTPAVERFLALEHAEGLTGRDYYTGFGDDVTKVCAALRTLLQDLKASGSRLAAYGAAAKGATLLNVAGIGTDLLDFVVDRNPHKQGLRMPGVGLPIRPVEDLLTERPDHVLLLAWNFADEIRRQQGDYLAGGGRFVVPVPVPSVLG
jgi:SAM-dependent methyltransferase